MLNGTSAHPDLRKSWNRRKDNLTQQENFSPKAVADAYSRIKSILHKTPVLTSSSFNSLTSPRFSVYFKAEMFQKTGVFKFRGASNSIAQLSESALKKGVVTHSSGNHSAALACAARERGVKCYVVMVRAPGPGKGC
jgi:threonine dehydratase